MENLPAKHQHVITVSMLLPCYCHYHCNATTCWIWGLSRTNYAFFLRRQFQDNIRLPGYLRIKATGLLHHLVPLPHTALCVLVLTTNRRLIKCLPRGFQRTTPRRQLETSYRSDSNIKPEV